MEGAEKASRAMKRPGNAATDSQMCIGGIDDGFYTGLLGNIAYHALYADAKVVTHTSLHRRPHIMRPY